MEEEEYDGPWDPKNLTEDFDLGMRLYLEDFHLGGIETKTTEDWEVEYRRKGKIKVDMMNSKTEEESPTTWKGWLKQRTRWQQGKLQTFKKMIKKFCKEFKENPKKAIKKIPKYLSVFMECNVAHLGFINFTGISLSAKEDGKSKKELLKDSLIIALLTPIYWIPQWVADLRAMYREYISKKRNWEKTSHKGEHIN